MSDSPIRSEIDGAVCTLTIDRPQQRNALSPKVLADLRQGLLDARDNEKVRVIIITGAGDIAFCAGADLTSFADAENDEILDAQQSLFVDLFLTMEQLGKPIIGAINGHALAGGFGLALMCDLLISADNATFGTPEIKVGVWPMMITAIIQRNLPRKRALELFLTGKKIDAATAMEWGLVNKVVPQRELTKTTVALAREIAGWSPRIMQLGRDAFYTASGMEFEDALRYLQRELRAVSLTEDFKEGVQAFLEKRAPQFKGR